MKRNHLALSILSILFMGYGLAQNTSNNFFIIPEETNETRVIEAVRSVSSGWGTVWDRYNTQADNLSNSVGDQFASGIMTWDTLIRYVVYLVRFLSQIALVIGAIMIIYAGYIYATGIFTSSWDGASEGNKAIRYAIEWIVVVASAYAIMRILTSAFLS
jgi:hypothetical protein